MPGPKFRTSFQHRLLLFTISLLGLLLTAVPGLGQSIYYFEHPAHQQDGKQRPAKTLLLLQTDGSASARMHLYDSATATSQVLSIRLIDSAVVDPQTQETRIYLLQNGNDSLVRGSEALAALPLRFVLTQQSDSSGIYFEPVALEEEIAAGNWKATPIGFREEKTYAELKKATVFLQQFYDMGDAMYKLLTGTSRGNPGPLLNRKEKIFLLIVANTLDDSIGATAQKDEERITALFSELSRQMRVKELITTRISGNSFSRKAVLSAIDAVSPGPDDILIFYYSGHGFRYDGDASQYPRLSLRKTKSIRLVKHNLRLEEDIYQPLLKKGAKLTLVLADCCNENIGAQPAEGAAVSGIGRGDNRLEHFNMTNAEHFFFPPKPVAMIVGAAAENQRAVGNKNMGGFFTYFFTDELKNRLYIYDPSGASWIALFSAAKEKARRQALTARCDTPIGRCIQTTMFRARGF